MRLRISLLLIFVIFICQGCLTFVLKHNKETLEKKAVKNIKVSIKGISITRPEKEGASSNKLVGYTRNGYGMPFPIEPENTLDEALKLLFSDALESAGYTLGDTNLKLQAEVLKFWCDGYMGYALTAEIKVNLFKDDKIVFTTTISEQKNFVIWWSVQEVYAVYDEIMNKIALKAVQAFSSDEFAKALSR